MSTVTADRLIQSVESLKQGQQVIIDALEPLFEKVKKDSSQEFS